jgi:hypothetical protein
MDLYDVTYTLSTENHINDRALRCIVVDGETTMDDFPKMIAIRTFGSVKYADRVTVLGSEFIVSL